MKTRLRSGCFLAGRLFNFAPTKVFNEKGGLITDGELIFDNDIVYVSDKELEGAADAAGGTRFKAAYFVICALAIVSRKEV